MALLIYNDNEFLETCLASLASAISAGRGTADTEVMVLDDCSTEVSFSPRLRLRCNDLGFQYYRSPRNLGIPRNMNLGLLWGTRNEFDHIILLNSDVVVPDNFVDKMLEAARAGADIGSVTPWSNNVSIFSLPLGESETSLAQADYVNSLSERLSAEFADEVLDLPSAVGFSMMISSKAIARVGLLDPIFGRGYCEEIDWSVRCKASGLRNVLAPSVFVYHSRHGSTRGAGVLAPGENSVPANEALIDFRYPEFRPDVHHFVESGELDTLIARAQKALGRPAGRQDALNLARSARDV